jgi:hypothetical protein
MGLLSGRATSGRVLCEENGFDADGSRVAIVVTGVSSERTAMPITTTMISLTGPMNP